MTINTKKWLSGVAVAVSALGLTACAGYDNPFAGNNANVGNVAYSGSGVVTDVSYMSGSSGSYGGAVIGAVVGGTAGNLWAGDRHRSRALPTGVGAVAGALIGEAIQQNTTGVGGSAPFYRVTVRLDNGQVRTFDYAQQPNVAVGTRVQVDGNQVYR